VPELRPLLVSPLAVPGLWGGGVGMIETVAQVLPTVLLIGFVLLTVRTVLGSIGLGPRVP